MVLSLRTSRRRQISGLTPPNPPYVDRLRSRHSGSSTLKIRRRRFVNVPHHNQERPHRTLRLQTPEAKLRPVTGPIRSRPVLNGLHHVYERAA
jgi:hypothetical protein